jgi:hypothetical protein
MGKRPRNLNPEPLCWEAVGSKKKKKKNKQTTKKPKALASKP